MKHIPGVFLNQASQAFIIFGFESSMVTTTIVGGKILMQDRQLLTLDEAEITARSRELAQKVWQRFEKISEEENS